MSEDELTRVDVIRRRGYYADEHEEPGDVSIEDVIEALPAGALSALGTLYEEHYSGEVQVRATGLVKLGRALYREAVQGWMVYGSSPDKPYTVRLVSTDEGDVWLTCTCANGKALGGVPRCYHTAAVAYLLTRYPNHKDS